MDLVWQTAAAEGLGEILAATTTAMEDDHIPFIDARIPSVDIIDFDYPPWHTEGDTLDKLSAASLEKVGRLVVAMLPRIEKRYAAR
jgi:hypothetical protein